MGLLSHLPFRRPARPAPLRAACGPNKVLAPVSGRVLPLSASSDPVFAQGMLGEGVCVAPERDGREGSLSVVYAPVAGTVAADVSTGHALLLRRDDGVEVLVHVGVDTVRLQGRGFTVFAKKGERVGAGEALIAFDQGLIESLGFDATVAVAVSDARGGRVGRACAEDVRAGEPLLTVGE